MWNDNNKPPPPPTSTTTEAHSEAAGALLASRCALALFPVRPEPLTGDAHVSRSVRSQVDSLGLASEAQQWRRRLVHGPSHMLRHVLDQRAGFRRSFPFFPRQRPSRRRKTRSLNHFQASSRPETSFCQFNHSLMFCSMMVVDSEQG